MFTPKIRNLEKREEVAKAIEGKFLPLPTVMYMKSTFTIPTYEEGFGKFGVFMVSLAV